MIRDKVGYEGQVAFDVMSIDPEARSKADAALKQLDDSELAAQSLLKEAGFEKGFTIQIQIDEEERVLADAAGVVRDMLLAIGLDATIEGCAGPCVRVYLGAPEEE